VLSDLSDKFNSIEVALAQQKKETEKAVNVTRMLASGELAAPAFPARSTDPTEDETKRTMSNWPDEVREGYESFCKAPREWDSNPAADIFPNAPSTANGLTLSGSIVETLPDVLILQLIVTPAPGSKLDGVVTFLLHPTLAAPTRHVQSTGGAAEVKFSSQGWFTAVAIDDSGSTILGLDLRTVDGVPDWFKKD
jgi:hypothetical protein